MKDVRIETPYTCGKHKMLAITSGTKRELQQEKNHQLARVNNCPKCNPDR